MERLTWRDTDGHVSLIKDADLVDGLHVLLEADCGDYGLETLGYAHDCLNYLADVVLARLAAYEDTGLEPGELKKVQDALGAISFGRFYDIMQAERAGKLVFPSEDNAPLTLEELREMDGEPVWIRAGYYGVYADVVHVLEHKDRDRFVSFKINYHLQENGYGKTWLAYRRKPGEAFSNA